MGFFDISDLFPDQKHLRTLKIALLVAAVYPFYLLTCYMAAKGFYASLALGVVLVIGQHVPATGRAAAYGLLLILAVLAQCSAASTPRASSRRSSPSSASAGSW
jgi:hypothetical protein